jgi:hypothetical protein
MEIRHYSGYKLISNAVKTPLRKITVCLFLKELRIKNISYEKGFLIFNYKIKTLGRLNMPCVA